MSSVRTDKNIVPIKEIIFKNKDRILKSIYSNRLLSLTNAYASFTF